MLYRKQNKRVAFLLLLKGELGPRDNREREAAMSTSTGFVLNALAPEYQPDPDIRCLFLTFSNGFPLTEFQIFAFFNRQV